MKKTILVTGGAGYIGSLTVKELLGQNYNVVVLDSLENGHKEAVDETAILEVADLANQGAIRAVFDKHEIDAVIDFAAYLAVGESMEQPEKYLKNNVENFVHLLDVMHETGCRFLIKSSTAATYGNPEEKYFPLEEQYHNEFKPTESALLPGKWQGADVVGEDFFQQIVGRYQAKYASRPELLLSEVEITRLRIPASIYGLTKLLDEIIMEKFGQKYGLNSVALRYFNVCGAALDGNMGEDKPKPSTLMTLCFWNILGKAPELSVFGTDYPTKDGTGVRDYIHPLDLASGHIAALEYLEKKFEKAGSFDVFNLGTGQGNSVFEVIRAVEAASGKKVDYLIKERRSGDPAVSYANSSKAKEVLGWSAKYNLEDMAKTAWKWHSSHPAGYKEEKHESAPV